MEGRVFNKLGRSFLVQETVELIFGYQGYQLCWGRTVVEMIERGGET